MTKMGRPVKYEHPWPQRDGELQRNRRIGMTHAQIAEKMKLPLYVIKERCSKLIHPNNKNIPEDRKMLPKDPKVTLPPLPSLAEPLYTIRNE